MLIWAQTIHAFVFSSMSHSSFHISIGSPKRQYRLDCISFSFEIIKKSVIRRSNYYKQLVVIQNPATLSVHDSFFFCLVFICGCQSAQTFHTPTTKLLRFAQCGLIYLLFFGKLTLCCSVHCGASLVCAWTEHECASRTPYAVNRVSKRENTTSEIKTNRFIPTKNKQQMRWLFVFWFVSSFMLRSLSLRCSERWLPAKNQCIHFYQTFRLTLHKHQKCHLIF